MESLDHSKCYLESSKVEKRVKMSQRSEDIAGLIRCSTEG